MNILDFIKNSPTVFHAAESVASILSKNGFSRRAPGDSLAPGGKYFTVFSDSAVVAYRIPNKPNSETALKVVASHGDSPAFKLKPKSEQTSSGVVRLMTEKYGGMIYSSWLDRPLALAGRAVCKKDGKIVSINVRPEGYAVIPNVAIHQNRKVNSGFEYNPQTDLQALWTGGETPLLSRIAESAGVAEEDVLDYDIFLVNPDGGMLWGADEEFISAPRLDDLQCVYSTLCGFLDAAPNGDIQVYAMFDSEEVGSRSVSGADSLILSETVREICAALGVNLLSVCEKGLMLSADNAHALHPNHPEMSDPIDRPVLNGGVVLKYNANQNYITSARGAAVVRAICAEHGIKLQNFVNRSDMTGGSTLGAISTTQLPISGADIGVAQLAMHSCYETAGARDTEELKKLVTYFF